MSLATPIPTSEGERLKRRAQTLISERRKVFVRRGRRALLLRLLAVGNASADDVRAVVELPPGLSPKLFGAVPIALIQAGAIRADGFRRTARREGHARPVQVWILADRDAAIAWLENNPDSHLGDGSQPSLFD
ncbi:MAG TPA: hypothetical protein VE988_04885 [Gemmataceae bacterium]|nr:hypothetical protein [Gemmataceae bacterium]